jgi:uncharacterized lipoprotein YmbA
MKYVSIALLLVLSACAVAPLPKVEPVSLDAHEVKQEKVRNCINDLLNRGVRPPEALEICRQVYQMPRTD